MAGGSTLVLVANATTGRFLCRDRTGARLVELADLGLWRDLAAPPAAYEGPAQRVSAISGMSSLVLDRSRQDQGAGFIASMVKSLVCAVEKIRAEHIVVCAPPAVMSAIWERLSVHVAGRLVLSLCKDLARKTPAEVDAILTRSCARYWPGWEQ